MKKDTTFSIRISSGDLDTIKRKATQARMSQSDYVTRCCLGRQVVVIDGPERAGKGIAKCRKQSISSQCWQTWGGSK